MECWVSNIFRSTVNRSLEFIGEFSTNAERRILDQKSGFSDGGDPVKLIRDVVKINFCPIGRLLIEYPEIHLILGGDIGGIDNSRLLRAGGIYVIVEA